MITRGEKTGGKNKSNELRVQASDEDTLRQEILALGGTQEDFDLLADVDSESEVEGATTNPKGKVGDDDLRKELSKLLEAAGHVVPDDLADEDVEEDADPDIENDEENNASEDDIEGSSEPEQDVSDISEDGEAPAPKKQTPEVVIPKEYAKLVSRSCAPPTALYANLR